jgi:hypothetical protein
MINLQHFESVHVKLMTVLGYNISYDMLHYPYLDMLFLNYLACIIDTRCCVVLWGTKQ